MNVGTVRAGLRLAWCLLSAFVVESIVFGLAVLPAVAFWEWHFRWDLSPAWLRVVVLSMAFVPAYIVFALSLIALSRGLHAPARLEDAGVRRDAHSRSLVAAPELGALHDLDPDGEDLRRRALSRHPRVDVLHAAERGSPGPPRLRQQPGSHGSQPPRVRRRRRDRRGRPTSRATPWRAAPSRRRGCGSAGG